MTGRRCPIKKLRKRPTVTYFTVNAPSAGYYNFNMTYTECCGAPAELIWKVNDAPVSNQVPEPASMILVASGIAAMSERIRRRLAR